jgi:hypothetical protein
MLSKTLLISVLAIANVVSADMCNAGTQTVNGRTCTLSCATDRVGGDYARMQTGTWTGCVQACAAESLCVAATYNEGTGFCYLKRDLKDASYAYGQDTVVCSAAPSGSSSGTPAPQCTPGTRNIGDTTCTISCDTDRPGGDYAQQQTGTLEGCIQACAAENLCVSATYNEANKFCYMKRESKAAVSNPGQDTVDCTQASYGCANPFTCAANQQSSNNLCGKDGSCYCFGFDSKKGVCFPNTSCNYPSCRSTQDCQPGNSCVGGCCGGICLPTSMSGTCSNSAAPSRLFVRDLNGRGMDNAGVASS